MKRFVSMLLLLVLILTACSSPSSNTGTNTGNGAPKGNEGSGKVMKEYTTVYSSESTTLNYLVSSLSENTEIVYQLVEGLVDFDKYGVMIPSVAESWEVSPDGLVYTFKLKEGIYWYTNTGEKYAEVTAQDFVDAAKYVLTIENESTTSNIVYEVIKNAEKYFDKEITDFNEVGIKAKDKYTRE
jgi:oligopeptide transport system substrate-binding protein